MDNKPLIDKVTLENVHDWLTASDDTFPETASVLDAYVDREDGSVLAKWIDDEEEEIYRDVIADAKDPNAAKRVYQFEPRPNFTRIWLNAAEDGDGVQPASQRLTPREVREIWQKIQKRNLRRPRHSELAWVLS